MEIKDIKEKLSSSNSWKSFQRIELIDMLESAMEEVELLEEQVRLLTKRAVDVAYCECKGGVWKPLIDGVKCARCEKPPRN